MYVRLNTNGRMQRKFGIFLTPSPKILDVFVRFFGRKNVRLGVNGNAACSFEIENFCDRISRLPQTSNQIDAAACSSRYPSF